MKRVIIILFLLQPGCGSRQKQLHRQQNSYSASDSSTVALQEHSRDSLWQWQQANNSLWLWLRGGYSYHRDSGLRGEEAYLYIRDSSTLLTGQGSQRARDSLVTTIARSDSSSLLLHEQRQSQPRALPWWSWLAGLALLTWLARKIRLRTISEKL
ncbi:hypothetical protein [Olivibacter sitiensis]|uniref:hypothetical protein n=1 Tax=Olivibacter sitiensis TaxID=376470 RepID=UPI000418E03A|nr:hypothetical protein [Olivibacter sitiensis]